MLALFFFSVSVHAGISGPDNRQETRGRFVSPELRELSYSVPAIVENNMLIPASGGYRPKGYSLQEMNYCPGIRFSGQQYLARCSSSLIGEDLVLTAAHCIDEDLKKWCSEYSVVFDYAVGADEKLIRKENVYGCKEVLYRKFDDPFGEDLALIKLERKSERRPIVVSAEVIQVKENLTMIGYPMGLPQKAVDDGHVLESGPLKYSFRHNLDTFSSNSGGPVFNSTGEQVGVLVRGTGPNFSDVPGKKCSDWGKDSDRDYAEANTLLHLRSLLP